LLRIQVLGSFTGARPTVSLQNWTLGSSWGQLYRPGWPTKVVGPTAGRWSGAAIASSGNYVSGRTARVYVDGGGRLVGPFSFSITGIRLVLLVGKLQ
jgi:hypothetical protein